MAHIPKPNNTAVSHKHTKKNGAVILSRLDASDARTARNLPLVSFFRLTNQGMLPKMQTTLCLRVHSSAIAVSEMWTNGTLFSCQFLPRPLHLLEMKNFWSILEEKLKRVQGGSPENASYAGASRFSSPGRAGSGRDAGPADGHQGAVGLSSRSGLSQHGRAGNMWVVVVFTRKKTYSHHSWRWVKDGEEVERSACRWLCTWSIDRSWHTLFILW